MMYRRIRTLSKGSNRVNRGGSWNNNARNCRVSNRNNNTPTNTNNNLGIRLALQLSLCNDGKNRGCILTFGSICVIIKGKSDGMDFRHSKTALSRTWDLTCLEKSHSFDKPILI